MNNITRKTQGSTLEVSRKVTHSRPLIIRKYCSDQRTYCGEIPTKKISYDI